MSHLMFWLIATCLFLSVHFIKGDNSRQCQRWGSVANNSTVSEPGLKMNCHRNSTCTGISCSGVYTYTIASFARTDVDFCFGFRLNPCFKPVSADIIVQVPEKSVNYVLQVHTSDNYQIPKLTYKLVGNIVKADVFLDVTMGSVTNGYVMFGVDLNVRADYALGQSWPEGLKRSLVKKQKLFVRHCSSSDPTPPQLVPGACHKMSPSTPTPKPSPTPSPKPGQVTSHPQSPKPTAAPKPTVTAAPGSGKTCDVSELGGCGPNEMCKGGVCTCTLENEDNSGNCKGYVTSTVIPPAAPSSSGQSTSDSKSNTTVIASSVVGAVVGILIIIAIVILVVRWRRARARYANHELLLSNDDNMVM